MFCKLSPLQQTLYTVLTKKLSERGYAAENPLEAEEVNDDDDKGEDAEKDDALSCITTLKKLCNHPSLVHDVLKVKNQLHSDLQCAHCSNENESTLTFSSI